MVCFRKFPTVFCQRIPDFPSLPILRMAHFAVHSTTKLRVVRFNMISIAIVWHRRFLQCWSDSVGPIYHTIGQFGTGNQCIHPTQDVRCAASIFSVITPEVPDTPCCYSLKNFVVQYYFFFSKLSIGFY